MNSISRISALRMQPDNVKAKYRRMQALYGLGRYKETLEEALGGMKRQPTVSRYLHSFLYMAMASKWCQESVTNKQ